MLREYGKLLKLKTKMISLKEQILASLRQSLQDAKAGRTYPVSELWKGIDVE